MTPEIWKVTQDGRTFYVECPDEEDAAPTVYEYPWPVVDGDMDGAVYARKWFMARIVPSDVWVEFQ